MSVGNRVGSKIEAPKSDLEATIEMKVDYIKADNTENINSLNIKISSITLKNLLCLMNRLVPDKAVHMVTIKRHKTDERIIHFPVHLSPSIFGLKRIAHYTQPPFKNTVGYIFFHLLVIA